MDAARAPVGVDVEVRAGAEPRLELLLVTGGSRWDPPGQEGRAWRSVHALRDREDVRVEVARDHAWIQIRCPTPTEACAAPLQAVMAVSEGDTDARDAAAQRLRDPAVEDLLEQAQMGLLFDGHPYAHPTAGRVGVLDQVRPTAPLWSRSTVLAKVLAPDAASAEPIATGLSRVLARLPSTQPPDAAMKAPSPPGELAATIPVPGNEGGVSVGVVLHRPPTLTTRLRPDAGVLQTVRDLRSCLADALPGLALVPYRESPDDSGPSELEAPVHPSLIWRGTGPPSALQGHLDGLADAMTQLPDAIASGCAADPERARAVLARSLAAGHAIVVATPRDIEDPWTPSVPGAEPLRLPAANEGLFR